MVLYSDVSSLSVTFTGLVAIQNQEHFMELIVTQEKVWEAQKERYGNPRLLVILMVGVKWQKAQTEKD